MNLLGAWLNDLQTHYVNVYIVLMMATFVVFFNGMTHLVEYMFPESYPLLSIGMVVFAVLLFTAQDGLLDELTLMPQQASTRAGAAVYMSGRMGN